MNVSTHCLHFAVPFPMQCSMREMAQQSFVLFTAALQVDRMYQYFSHNMAVVDFFLSGSVFQTDTKQVCLYAARVQH